MIMHICDVDFTLARPALLPLLCAFFNCVLGPALLPKTFPLVDPATAVHLLLLANFSLWLHFIWNASQSPADLAGGRACVVDATRCTDWGVAVAQPQCLMLCFLSLFFRCFFLSFFFHQFLRSLPCSAFVAS